MKKGIKPKMRVFCRAIRRSKILFETEKKAENFIKFNAAEIKNSSGVAPIRAYFCEVCGGWHVTHRRTGGLVNKKISKFIDRHKGEATKEAPQPVKKKPEDYKEVAEKYFLTNYSKFSTKKEFRDYLKQNPDNLNQLTLEWVRHLVKEQVPEIYTMDIDLSQNYDNEVNALLQEIPQNILADRDLLANYIKWEIQYKKQVNPAVIYFLRERLRKEDKL